ncbi:MAG: succinylglutamate desuccinylase/aspartoacylase family protein [Ignavibacteriales bacterium]
MHGGKEPIQLDEVASVRGARQDGYIRVALKADGSWVRIPVIIVRGHEDGPTLLVDACTHGDEYEGAEAVIETANTIDPSRFRGTLVGVPAVNFDAFCANTRWSPIDQTNLNRVFPGGPDKYITPRIAFTHLQRLISRADYLISFHGGGVVLHLEPMAGYLPSEGELGDTSARMARAFGTKVIWRMQNLPFEGISTAEAAKLGIPAVLPEIGSHCSRLHERRKNVHLCANGILNVMKCIGMMDGDIQPVESQIEQEMHYIHTGAGGIHIPLKGVLETAEKGEVLARITDVFGRTTAEVKAPFDGVVVGFWSVPVIGPGDWSYLFGKLV